jgi:hypothetical protein
MYATKERYIDEKKMEALQGRKTSEGSEVDNQSRWYHSEVIHQVGW